MNVKHLLPGLLLAMLFFAACKKDVPDTNDPDITDSLDLSTLYFPLGAGNYWVYQHSTTDTTSTQWTPMDIIDTLTVVDADTLIGTEHFAMLIDRRFHSGSLTTQDTSFLRDSSGFLVNDKGRIQLSVTTGNTILFHEVYDTGSDTLYYGDYRMKTAPSPVVTSLGSFTCLDLEGEIYVISDGFSQPWYTHTYYAENTGMVTSINFFLSDPRIKYKRELTAFHVQ